VVRPARLPPEMIAFAFGILRKIRFSRADVADFLGRYLSAPKPYVVFKPSTARGAVVRLDPKTQLLYCGTRFFMNGESFTVRRPQALRELADRRRIRAARLAPVAELVAEWRRAGYVHYAKKERRHG